MYAVGLNTASKPVLQTEAQLFKVLIVAASALLMVAGMFSILAHHGVIASVFKMKFTLHGAIAITAVGLASLTMSLCVKNFGFTAGR